LKKLIMMSILIATFAIPLVMSSRPVPPRRAVKLVQKHVVWFCIAYVIALCYVWPRL
jgi:hypothetical protein